MRRYELDWLRLFLFGLLVPYHAALGFVSYGPDVYGIANDVFAGLWLELLLDWSHSWRIFALFMISGVGTWFASRKGAGIRFAGSRLHRLGLPLIGWGGFALVAIWTGLWPADAFFWVAEGETGWRSIEFVDFWHLWFLKNLLIYTLICIPLLRRPDLLTHRGKSMRWTVIVISAVMFIVNALLEPISEAVIGLHGDDFYNFIGFVLGIWIGANAAKTLDWMARWWWVLLLYGTASYPLTLTFQLAYYEIIESYDTVWSLYGEFKYMMWHALRPVNGLLWGMGLFGFASRFLSKPGRHLKRLNSLVFPLYVFHMPITIAGIAIAADLRIAWQIEMLTIIAVTFVVSILLAFASERLGWFAYFFGATPKRR
ncbi:MAG: acyltransferase family protein [Paracoccaceae bacterium]|nr:acyltransferase family protein [Paracoccaceae bacterium]MDG1736711.1 acyltransferase family protein [Paracoccaceae bacterium]MDG2257542.1 acyltransferase family protein [Paracoccaceae bacterium]